MKLIWLFLLLTTVQALHAQTNAETALQKAKDAIKIEDESGKYNEAIALLQEAQKLDPDNINYPYEVAYAYSTKKEYKKAADILEQLINRKDAFARVYQALGNAYDEQGKPDKAIETYEMGLKKFPNAGELYLEMGNMKLNKKEYDNALPYYEKGIEVNPQFPSNYYWAAKIFCGTTEKVWGMIYGELFMNLERNSKRTAEISKLLFDTYKSQIKFKLDSSISVSFSKNATINIDALKDPKQFKMPFGMGCYEIGLTIAVIGEKQIDINSLDRIRTRFLDNYFKNSNATTYPNILFDYQQKVKAVGHFEAYNHWILMKGNEDAFNEWKGANETKWTEFTQWFTDNKLQLDANNKFYRAQY